MFLGFDEAKGYAIEPYRVLPDENKLAVEQCEPEIAPADASQVPEGQPEGFLEAESADCRIGVEFRLWSQSFGSRLLCEPWCY